MTEYEGTLIGMCNPLLDISANGVEQEFFDKYDIKLGQSSLAEEKHLPIYEEMKKRYKVEYIAGGAGQNSIRATQWLLQIPGATSYIGGIGNDENGKYLKEKAEENGVKTLYHVDKDLPTGTCAVLIQNKERSLIANLGASNSYKKEHFDTPEIQAYLKKAKFIYCTGFFASHDTAFASAKYAVENNKFFLFNLSAVFVVEYQWERVSSLIPYVDVFFGNEDEWTAFGKKMNWGTDLKEIAQKTSELPKINKVHPRVVVVTQGSRNTIVSTEGKIYEYRPIKLAPEKIIDTNGAGDSFVGGFLAGLILQKPISECVRAAHYIASECVQRSGPTWPEKPNFTFN